MSIHELVSLGCESIPLLSSDTETPSPDVAKAEQETVDLEDLSSAPTPHYRELVQDIGEPQRDRQNTLSENGWGGSGNTEFAVSESKDEIYFVPPGRRYYYFQLKTVPYRELDIEDVCKDWEKLLIYCEKLLQTASNQILREDGDIPRGLLRSLTKVADLVTHVEGVYSDFYRMAASSPDLSPSSQKKLDHIKKTEAGLASKIDTLIQRASNIMSIDEAYKSREQGASIKRLTWITFIFLPLLFVSGLFGMNIDLLKDNPAWWTYLCIALPVGVFMFLGFLGMKHHVKIRDAIRRCQRRHLGDEENQLAPFGQNADSEAFLAAGARGHTVLVGKFLSIGISTKTTNANGQTALHLAAMDGHDSTVRLLFTEGKANTEAKDNGGLTALHWAAGKGYESTVRLLLTEGKANVEAKDTEGWTPLFFAANGGHESTVRLLIAERKASVEAKNSDGQTALHLAANGGHESTVRLLLTEGKANAEAKDNGGLTALHWAAMSGREATVRLLLTEGKANVEAKEKDGWTALHWAAINGQEATARLLLTEGKANVEAKEKDRWTALHWAAMKGYEGTVRLLLTEGKANVEVKDNGGWTALHWAAMKGHEATVRLLLTEKASVEAKDNIGWTALHWAASKGYESTVRLLLIEGKANMEAKNNKGETAIDVAPPQFKERMVALCSSST